MKARTLWMFNAKTDLLMFALPVLVAVAVVLFANLLGLNGPELPLWFWLAAAVFLDSAHVYGMLFRVYFDPQERQRRPLLYFGAPIVVLLFGAATMSVSLATFWRALTYVAIYHFIKQQVGWLAIYHRKEKSLSARGRLVDKAAILLSMLWPIAYWHTAPAREWVWFARGELVSVPALIEPCLRSACFGALVIYVCQALRHGQDALPLGKHLLVIATFVCWGTGLVWTNADAVFTATNSALHSIPYLVLIYHYGRQQAFSGRTERLWRCFRYGPPVMLLVLMGFGLCEDLLWDRLVWHQRAALFGSAPELTEFAKKSWVVLLCAPQYLHFYLDAFVWKGASNPTIRSLLGSTKPAVV